MPFGLYEVSGGTYSLVRCLSIDNIVVDPALAKGFLTCTAGSGRAALDEQGCFPAGVESSLGTSWHLDEVAILAYLLNSLKGSSSSNSPEGSDSSKISCASKDLHDLRIVVDITPGRSTVHLAEIKGVWGYTYTTWRGHGQYWIPVMLKLRSLWLDVNRKNDEKNDELSLTRFRPGIDAEPCPLASSSSKKKEKYPPKSFRSPEKAGRVHFEFFYITGKAKPTVALGRFNHPLLSGEALAYFTCVMRKELMNEPRPCGGLDICGCDQC